MKGSMIMTSFPHSLIRAALLALLFVLPACGGDGDLRQPLPPGGDPNSNLTDPKDPTDPSDPNDPNPTDDPNQTDDPDPQDPNNPPSAPFTSAHVDRGCSPTLFQINLGTLETQCSTLWLNPDDLLQITVGESVGLPPAGGRTYTITSQDMVDMYPDDGEAIAVYIMDLTNDGAAFNVKSGTLIIDPWSDEKITGRYDVALGNGDQLTGTFTADICPDEGYCE